MDLLPSIVAVSVVLLVVCYRLNNKSPDVSWTISPIVLWAGTEINLGVVTACLPSLRPIYLLIRTGSAKPSDAKGSRKFNDTYTLRNRAAATFGSRGRNARTLSGTETEDDNQPFTMIQDDKHSDDNQNTIEHPQSRESNIDAQELRPPRDRVMVRDDISVRYSDV